MQYVANCLVSSFCMYEFHEKPTEGGIRMAIGRLSERLKKIEKNKVADNGVLIIDQNEDGTFGKDNLTKDELHAYAEAKHYGVIIIDDISFDDT